MCVELTDWLPAVIMTQLLQKHWEWQGDKLLARQREKRPTMNILGEQDTHGWITADFREIRSLGGQPTARDASVKEAPTLWLKGWKFIFAKVSVEAMKYAVFCGPTTVSHSKCTWSR